MHMYHESQSSSPRAATSPGTVADSSSKEPIAECVSSPPGVLELQSLVVVKCSEWIEKQGGHHPKRGGEL
jgi:hypothetical protein